MGDTSSDHWKFYKPKVLHRMGDFFPNVYLHQDNGAERNETQRYVYDFITDHLIVLVVSTSCDACLPALNATEEYLEENPHANVVILIDTDESSCQLVKDAFIGKANVFLFPKQRIITEIFARGLPWGYALNAEGRILVTDSCGSMEKLEMLSYPYKFLFSSKHNGQLQKNASSSSVFFTSDQAGQSFQV